MIRRRDFSFLICHFSFHLFRPPAKSRRIIDLLLQAGARDCLFVGGYVRDYLFGIKSKDIDIEVYGLTYGEIAKTLGEHFRIDIVGQSFGVIKVGHDTDVSIPRRESKTGIGHTAFHVETDSNLTPLEAFGRRDFTINAIGMRPDGSLCDPYDGQGDLERKILRATTDAFGEDPLRVLRGMQFAARFGFAVEPRTIELCRLLLPEFETLAAERVWTEWYKWATKSRYPSKGLQFLRDTGWVEKFPELAATIACPQHPKWHPEGDVFTHTLWVCDEAERIAQEASLPENERAELMFAALCHDFGKPATLSYSDENSWTSPNHAAASGPPARAFLSRMKAPHQFIAKTLPLVLEHMAPLQVPTDEIPSNALVRRLAVRLAPANIRMWGHLCLADRRGCGGLKNRDGRVVHWLNVAEKLSVLDAPPVPLLQGRDLLPLGMEPGPEMGKLLKAAYEAQLDGVIQTTADAIKWALAEDRG